MSLMDKLRRLCKNRAPEKEPGLNLPKSNYNVVKGELARICNLPIIEKLDRRTIEDLNYKWVEARAYAEGFRLFDSQVEAIEAFRKYNGLFAPLSVGAGKTAVTLKIADLAYREKGVERSILLVPSQVYEQLTKVDIPWAFKKLGLGIVFYTIGGMNKARRTAICERKRPGCYVMPYSYLSVVDTVDMLDMIEPKLIICDEAHLVKNIRAARTRRLFNYIKKHAPIMFVALSGTITTKSVKDYFHLLHYSLDENSPLPRPIRIVQDWGAVLDSAVEPTEGQLKMLSPLLRWAKTSFPKENFSSRRSGYRKAYRKRLHTAPGVVATADSGVGTSIVFHNEPAGKPSEELRKLMEAVETQYLTPNGDEIEHAIFKFKWLYELSSGFYNALLWPTPEEISLAKNVSLEEAQEALARAQEQHQEAQEYARLLRQYLKNPHPKIDTPMLVGLEISRNGGRRVGTELAAQWRRAKSLEWEGMPERYPVQIRVDPYKIEKMIAWAKSLPKKTGALIWVYHQEMGRWATEALREAGLDPLYAAAGQHGNRVITNPRNASRIIVASIMAHGKGKNLQRFQEQFFLQWPRSAEQAEQVLGRTHRQGQKADMLIYNLCLTTEFDHQMFGACLVDSLYIHQSTGNRQKLIFGTYDPMPRVYTSEFLWERGMQNQRLTLEQKKIFFEKFGLPSQEGSVK
jgi:hypothetical protein